MAGAGYKLFQTGDVLTATEVNTYLQQQVTMVFADSAARTTALSGVLAEGMMSYLQDTNTVEVYDGSSWVSVGNTGDITGVTAGTGLTGGGTSGTVTLTNDMATTITTKGDILVGTGAGTYARLGVGSNNSIIVADSAETTGLKWAAPAAAAFKGCRLFKTTTQSLSNATNTAITFDDESFDTDGFHSTVTNNSRITIPAGLGGKYLIIGKIMFASNASVKNYGASIRVNASATLSSVSEWDTSTQYENARLINEILDLAAGDYLELLGYQETGGSLNVVGLSQKTMFAVQYLGA